MTKQEIIKILKQKQTRGRYNVPFIPCAECDGIADTLLAKIEQEKKEQAREFLRLLERQGVDKEMVECCDVYDVNGVSLALSICRKYGVEL